MQTLVKTYFIVLFSIFRALCDTSKRVGRLERIVHRGQKSI